MMTSLLLAQGIASWSIMHWLLVVVVVAAAIGVLYVVLPQFGVTIPPFVTKIFWILVAACLAILAIKFLFSLL